MKFLITLLLICSCATQLQLRTQPAKTACGAALELKIEGYFAGCDYVELHHITKISDGGYIAEGKCKHYKDRK